MKRATRNGVDTTPAFLNVINTRRELYKVDLLQIQLAEATRRRSSSATSLGDVDIPFEGLVWSAQDAKWEQGTTKDVIGTEAHTMDLTGFVTSADLLPPADATQPTERLPLRRSQPAPFKMRS